MGFLSSLGEVAQGANKGLLAAQEINERRARREAAELQTKLAKEKDERDYQLSVDIAKQPKLGDSIGLGGVDYQLKANEPPPAPVKEDSFLGKVAGRLAGVLGIKDVNDVAVATGVKPPPPVVGLGTGQAAAAPAARAAAPIAPPPAAAPAEPTITPSRAPADYATGLPATAAAPAASVPATRVAAETVTPAAVETAAAGNDPKVPDRMPVSGSQGQLTRPTNAIDRELYLAQAYARARDIPMANEHYKKHGDLIIDRHLKMIDHGTPSEMTFLVQKLSKQPYKVTQNGDNPDLFDMSLTETGADGKPVETKVVTGVTRGGLKGHIGQYLDQDPAIRDAAIKASEEQVATMLERGVKIEGLRATIGKVKADTAQTQAAMEAARQAATKEQRFEDDVNWSSNNGAYLLDQDRFDRHITGYGILKDGKLNTTETGVDEVSGATIKKEQNRLQAVKDATIQTWKTNPYSVDGKGVVQVAIDPKTGQRQFALMNIDTGKPEQFFPTMTDAYNAAKANYPDPKTANTAMTKFAAAQAAAAKANTPEAKAAKAKAAAAATAAAAKKAEDAARKAARDKATVGMPETQKNVYLRAVDYLASHKAQYEQDLNAVADFKADRIPKNDRTITANLAAMSRIAGYHTQREVVANRGKPKDRR
jgi:hypothetical protein